MPSAVFPPMPGRSRPASAAELRTIPWLQGLPSDRAASVGDAVRVVEFEPGERVCRHGRPVTCWFGVVSGLLKMSNDALDGTPMTLAGLSPGGWFGEGTVLKREPYRYDVQALRRSVVAGISVETFDELLEDSIAFNRFLMQQLNERLGQFIAARETDRLTCAEERVARSLASLFHPVLFPGVGQLLRITQQELAYLVGLSRQRVNAAMQVLEKAGLIAIEYGGVRVRDLGRLATYRSAVVSLEVPIVAGPGAPAPWTMPPPPAQYDFGRPSTCSAT